MKWGQYWISDRKSKEESYFLTVKYGYRKVRGNKKIRATGNFTIGSVTLISPLSKRKDDAIILDK